MKYYKIAGLFLALDAPDFEYINSKFAKYSLQKAPDRIDCTINIKYNEPFDVTGLGGFSGNHGRTYYNNGKHRGFYDYVEEKGKYYSLMQTDLSCSEITFYYNDLEPDFGIPSDVGICNVIGNLFKEVVIHNDGLVVHASTVVYDGCAVTFTAPSGTGKSTHTSLWKKYYPQSLIINDDSPALRFVDGELLAYGTPWSGKTDINENISAPLRAMVFIERGDVNTICPITPTEAFVRMIKEIPVYTHKELSDRMMSALNKIFTSVPSYLLKCNMSKDAVDVVVNEIFNK